MYSNPSNFMTSRDKYVHSQQKHGRIDVSADLNNCASEYWPRPVYDDHDRLNLELKEKVDGLRSLSIKIGDELRSQNNLLGDMSGAFDRSEGVLRSTMSRLSRMTRQNLSSGLCCYLVVFVCIIFFMCWFILRFL
uniref:SJCHGC04443 protein n=1 Tax=Schistosoma japonicum TaxID=6182 RepID=Q5DCK5_SCHJA|nr:SJCHGC04443 protein [Schistosoma japonicum]